MKPLKDLKLSYFPGCSLSTSAKENNQSLIDFCRLFHISLEELPDWNCCGSSSAHSINHELAFQLASRNLSLADPDRLLLVTCPGCYLRLKETQHHLKNDISLQASYRQKWKRPFSEDLQIIHFFELILAMQRAGIFKKIDRGLKQIKFAPYYGCMLAHSPELPQEKNFCGILEKIGESLNAKPISWFYASKCCGTFLTAARPDIVSPIINSIIQNAINSGAECIVTACAMCHLNLEMRCTLKKKIPIMHFSEMLALAYGIRDKNEWFSRHLIDPRPLFEQKGII